MPPGPPSSGPVTGGPQATSLVCLHCHTGYPRGLARRDGHKRVHNHGRLSGGTGSSRWHCHLGVAGKGGKASDGALYHHLFTWVWGVTARNRSLSGQVAW